MLKYIVILTGIFLVTNQVVAQKILQKEFNASGFETLTLNSDDVFTVNISTKKTDKITIQTHVEGEHYESVVVNTSEKNRTLLVTTGYAPFFKKENDKLAAHKVIAIDMVITLPETLKVEIASKIASVTGKGTFKNMSVALEKGTCLLKNFKGNATLYTKEGAITVYAMPHVAGEAVSKKGTVTNQLADTGMYKITAESITGAITLLQNK